MIAHRYEAIYIHQRKAAGTSIITSFGLDPKMDDWHLYNDGVLTLGWETRPDRELSYFIFSSVRNPFDRLVSSWKYLKSTRDRALEEVLADPPREGHDFRHFTRPQAAILCDAQTGALIAHDVVRFESLQSDFDRICKQIGKPRRSLAHSNATRRERQWRPYFTSTARALAESLFSEDLGRFDYSF